MPVRIVLILGIVAAALGLLSIALWPDARPSAGGVPGVAVVHAPATAPAVAPHPTPSRTADTEAAHARDLAALAQEQDVATASQTNDAPSEEEWRAVFAAAPGYKEQGQ